MAADGRLSEDARREGPYRVEREKGWCVIRVGEDKFGFGGGDATTAASLANAAYAAGRESVAVGPSDLHEAVEARIRELFVEPGGSHDAGYNAGLEAALEAVRTAPAARGGEAPQDCPRDCPHPLSLHTRPAHLNCTRCPCTVLEPL